jgi:hypothetical protein
MKLWAVCWCICVLLAAGCGVTRDINEVRPVLPAYPGAQQVQTGEFVKEEGSANYVQRTSFTTTDPPAEVLAFYREKLPASGWTILTDPTPGPGKLTAVLRPAGRGADRVPVYALYITVNTGAGGPMEVDLELAEYRTY